MARMTDIHVYLLLLFNLSGLFSTGSAENWPDDIYDISAGHPDCLLNAPVAQIEASKYVLKNDIMQREFESCVALGIPYSSPLLGPGDSFRFGLTRMIDYQGIINASKFGARCVPIDSKDSGPQNITNENCLFMNVFIPHKFRHQTGNEDHPILMLIHGGGFSDGSAEDFDIKGILRNFVSRGVVVVSVNYRLGPLGFYVGNDVETVNAGLYDLLQAFSFIYSNAEAFRGDRNMITLLGIDSGAVLAQLMGLYGFPGDMRPSGIVAIGGSLSMPWAVSANVAEACDDLIRILFEVPNLTSINKENIMYDARCASLDKLQNATNTLLETKKRSQDFIRFAPTFDKTLFGAPDLGTAMRNAQPFPIFYIGSEYDGLIRTTAWDGHHYSAFSNGVAITPKEKAHFTCAQFYGYLDTLFENKSLKEDIKREYRCNGSHGFDAYEKLMSDYFFLMPMINDAMFFAKHNHQVFLGVYNSIHYMLNETYRTNYIPISKLAETVFFTIKSPHHDENKIDHNEFFYYRIHRDLTVDHIVQFVRFKTVGFKSFRQDAYKNYSVYGMHYERVPKVGDIGYMFRHLDFWSKMIATYGYSVFNANLKSVDDEFKE